MKNIFKINRTSIPKKIRYIIDESFGTTDNTINTSWVEIQVFSNNKNVAFNKKVNANFTPNIDVTGHSGIESIVNNKISLNNWVSCNLSLLKTNSGKIIIDLGAEYAIDEIKIYHGWWNRRGYKNKIYLSNTITSINKYICIYDYEQNGIIYEYTNAPMVIKIV